MDNLQEDAIMKFFFLFLPIIHILVLLCSPTNLNFMMTRQVGISPLGKIHLCYLKFTPINTFSLETFTNINGEIRQTVFTLYNHWEQKALVVLLEGKIPYISFRDKAPNFEVVVPWKIPPGT